MKLSAAVSKVMNNPDRGPKVSTNSAGQDYLGIIRSAVAVGCPYVFLMENGFHDNVTDEQFLLKDNNLRLIAAAQAETLATHFGWEKKSTPAESAVHWAEQYWKQLNSRGITITEKRYDDPITRGELFALLSRLLGVN